MASNQAQGTLTAEFLRPQVRTSDSQVILYLHGGAYVMCSAKGHRILTTSVARESKTSLMAINYRLAPENPFPLALHDALSAYLFLLESYDPKQIVIMGDSAGGGLVFSLSLLLRDLQIAQPAGLVAFAPWLDLTHSLPSFRLQSFDYLPAQSHDPKWIRIGHRSQYYTTSDVLNTNYLVSPLFARETQPLPPSLIHIGSHERLRDESIMFACKTMAHSPIKLEIFLDQIHVFQVFSGELAASLSLKKSGEFIQNSLNGKLGLNHVGVWEIEATGSVERQISKKEALEYIERGRILLETMALQKTKHQTQTKHALPKNLAFYRLL